MIKRRPQILCLVVVDVVWIVMADLFQFVLALSALAYSTWIVLPWAFYEKLEDKVEREPMEWLRTSQMILFVAGTLFVTYVLFNFARELTGLPSFVVAVIQIAEYSTLTMGISMLLVGLYDAFRVVNFCSHADTRNLAIWVIGPFLVFDGCVLLTLSLGLYNVYPEYVRAGQLGQWLLYLVYNLATVIGTLIAVYFYPHISELARRPNVRGIVSLVLLFAPVFLIVALYLANIISLVPLRGL